MIKPIEILRRYPNPRMEMHSINNSFSKLLFPSRAENEDFDNMPVYPEGEEYISNKVLPLPKFEN